MKMKRSFKPGSQQREGAQSPLGFAHGCWWHRCWHQCAVSILRWQVQRQTPGEGQSAICPKSHTLGSSPGLPLASPDCLSPAGREKEKTNVFGDAARCQVMPWGHSCTVWLHIFCGGHFLYPFVGLESCLPFWLCFEHYLPAFLPSLVSCLPWREATLDSQAGFCHCKFQTAFNRNYRHLSWCVFFFFSFPSGIRNSNHLLPLINYFPPYLLHFPAEPFCRYNRAIFRDNLVIITNSASYATGIKRWKLPEVHCCTPNLYLWTPVPRWKCKQRRYLESFWQFIKLSRD